MKLERFFAVLSVGLMVGEICAPAAGTNVSYFLVASNKWWFSSSSRYNDSYVLPLNQTADIAHARGIIQGGPETNHPVVGVYISTGADGINCNYVAPDKPLWTWHVLNYGVIFGSAGMPEADGTPTLVETRRTNWIKPDGLGGFAFSCYTVVAEIDPPMRAALTADTKGVTLRWPWLGDNYAYTVESCDSLESPDWAPASGGAWPTAALAWTDPTVIGPRFYRLKIHRLESQ